MYKKGKKERNELQLPTLHYIAADDWIDKLGYEAFGVWLKMNTWVDRKNPDRKNDNTIPTSLEKTWKKLGMSKSKFYRVVIRPLWNYGLIDIVEYENSNSKGTKPKNILVYESPQNTYETKILPLEKIRDYETEYTSVSQLLGKKGGRPSLDLGDGFKNETVGGFKNKTPLKGGFKNETGGVSKMKRGGVSKMKPNNVSNNYNNDSNIINNVSNHHPEIEQTQQEVSVTQDQNMVVEVKLDVFNHFQTDISTQEATRLIKHASKYKKNLSEVIQSTKDHFLSTKKPINDLMASLMHGITKGWDKPKKAVVSKPLPQSIKATEKQVQNMQPEENENLEDTYADIMATMEFLRSTEKQILHSNE